MRKLFLFLFLFTLCSSRRIHRRSEDVDPLLKELFSEISEPVAKDRRDGQTSGDQDTGTATTEKPAGNDVPTDKPEKSDSSDDSMNNDSTDKKTTSAPASDSMTSPDSMTTPDSQDSTTDNDAKKAETDDTASMTTPSSDTSDTPDSMSAADTDKTKSAETTEGKSAVSDGKAAAQPEDASSASMTTPSSDTSDTPDSMPAADTDKTKSAETTESKPAVSDGKAAAQPEDATSKSKAETSKPVTDKENSVAASEKKDSKPEASKPEIADKKSAESVKSEPASSDEQESAVASSEQASASSEASSKQSADVMENEPVSSDEQKSAVASSEQASANADTEAPETEHEVSDKEKAAVTPEKEAAVTPEKEEPKSEHSDKQSAEAMATDPSSSAEQKSTETSSEHASANDKTENENSDVPEDKSDETSMSETASNTAAETPDADINSDVGSQGDDMAKQAPSAPSSEQKAVPQAAASTVIPSNSDSVSSNNAVDTHSNIPAAPTTLSQAAWSAASPLSVAPQSGSLETNEKQGSVKKDSIPAAPVQPGTSSYPLQLNKHSPGAELIKRFFIAKKEAKKRKEEEAKMKSLIGDGKYSVSANNGYYNYASAPPVPSASPNGVPDNGKEGLCVDKYDSCPEFAKNHYCTDYKTLMKVQCRKSCKFCDGDEEDDDDDDDDDKFKTATSSKHSDEDDDDDDNDKKADDKKKDDEEKKSDDKGDSKEASSDDDDDDDDDKKPQSDKKADDDDDDDLPAVSSGSAEGSSDTKDKKLSEKGEQFQDVEEKDKGSGKEDLPPTAEEFENDDEDEKKGKGSGSDDDNSKEDDDSDELAKDLAEQELFNEQKSKKDSIPRPHPAIPAAYPKIDLKDIARYVSLYRNVAKKLFGEALDSAKKEFVAQQSKKSNIPVPIKERLRSEKNSGDSLEGFYSSQNNKRDKIMNPNNAQYSPDDEQWANKAYEEAESYLRSKIPAFKNYAPPAMFNYPFYINDPKKNDKEEDETNEGTSSKKSEIPDSPEQKYNKTLTEILRRDHVPKKASDPYEYLRNMIPGSSMKPIASKNGIMYVQDTYSRPIQLNTKSQYLDIVAKKRASIPKAPAARARSNVVRPAAVPQIQTGPEAQAAQVTQYKSTVPSSYTTQNPAQEIGSARAQVPQPQQQQQQFPAGENANFLESSEAVDPAAATFQQVDSRSKVAKRSPLAKENRKTHHKN